MYQHLRLLLPLLFVIFIDSFGYFIIIPVLLRLFYNNDYGLLPSDTSQAVRNILTGFAISSSLIAGLLAAPLIGSASDKYGRKRTILGCLTCMGLGFLLPIIGIWQKSVSLIFMGRLLGGIGSTSQPIAQAAVADVCKDKAKSYFFSLIALMMTLPMIVGPLAGGYLADTALVAWFDITTPFWVACFISVISLVLIYFLFNETLAKHRQVSMLSVTEVFTGLNKAMKKFKIRGLLLALLCLEIGWSQYYQFIPLYLHQQLNYDVEGISLFNSYLGILMAVGLLFIYPMLLRICSIETIMCGGLMLVFVGVVVCGLFPSATMQWVCSPLISVFTGIAYVSIVTMMSNQVPLSHQGWVMGYISTALFSAWAFTAFNTGWLTSLHVLLPFYIAIVVLAIGVLIIRGVYVK